VEGCAAVRGLLRSGLSCGHGAIAVAEALAIEQLDGIKELGPEPAPEGSPKDEQETPDDLYEYYNQDFHFGLDAAASGVMHKHENYLTKTDNALIIDWAERSNGKAVWCNPPYSKGLIDKFSEAIVRNAQKVIVVCFVRNDPSADWFKNLYANAKEYHLLTHRVKHKGQRDSYNFPQCVFVLKPGYKGSPHVFYSGWVPSTARKSKLVCL
jgi:phage N-6-adenine-methyltransferase